MRNGNCFEIKCSMFYLFYSCVLSEVTFLLNDSDIPSVSTAEVSSFLQCSVCTCHVPGLCQWPWCGWVGRLQILEGVSSPVVRRDLLRKAWDVVQLPRRAPANPSSEMKQPRCLAWRHVAKRRVGGTFNSRESPKDPARRKVNPQTGSDLVSDAFPIT